MAVVPGIGQREHHARKSRSVLLQDDRPHLRLRVEQSRQCLNPNLKRWPDQDGVDRPPIERVVRHRHLCAPGPSRSNGRLQPTEQANLASVTQRGAARKGPYRHVEPDDRSQPRELDTSDVIQLPAFDGTDELTRAAEGRGHRILRQPCVSSRITDAGHGLRYVLVCQPSSFHDRIALDCHSPMIGIGALSAPYRSVTADALDLSTSERMCEFATREVSQSVIIVPP